MPQEGATILVVDDDILVLQATKKMLAKGGYAVITAQDGEEALQIYQRQKQEIALIFADMLLPKIPGLPLLYKLRAINHKVKVVFTSGYLAADARRGLVNAGAIDFIQKPYIPEVVLATVRSALRRP